MIREIQPHEYGLLRNFIEGDPGRNYFILLGLASKKRVYEKIYGEFIQGELVAALFKRLSSTLQFYARKDFDLDAFVDLIASMDYSGLISPKSYSDRFLNKGIFSSVEEGAYISKLEKERRLEPRANPYPIRKVGLEDLDQIVDLYRACFPSFSPREVMEEKLRTGRGRGLSIEEDGEIVSLAQTDFEGRQGALIVGVATRGDHRAKGLASACLEGLIEDLQKEGKDLYLQFDNLEAGRIYERLGFRIIDQVGHYRK